MRLFALLGVPVFALFCFALDRWLNGPLARPVDAVTFRPAGRVPLLSLLWGSLYTIPCLFIAAAVGRIFPLSYRPLLLYLRVLGQDQLFQLGLLGLAYLTFMQSRDFRELAFFAAGYLSVVSFAGAISASAPRNAYGFFLLPATRLSAMLLLPWLFAFRLEPNGPGRAVFWGLAALVPLTGALIGFFYARYRLIAAIIVCVLFLAASLSILIYGGQGRLTRSG